MADDTPTDGYDFGLGYGDPRDGKGIDWSALQAKPGLAPPPHSELPDGTDPETLHRDDPDSGEARKVTHPHRYRKTPTEPSHQVTSPSPHTTYSSSTLPGDGQYVEHDEYYNLGDAGMLTVEDLSRPKKDQPSDDWPDWDEHLASRRIRHLAASLRSTNA